MSLSLSAIHVYPIKSCAALSPALAEVQARGLQGDRRWMIVDATLRFVTGRQQPRLTLLQAQPLADGLQLQAPGMAPLHLREPAPTQARLAVQVWRSAVEALPADAAADAWLSEYLQAPARFVYMDAAARRSVDPQYARPDDEVSFADGFPLLLIGEASLQDLNTRLRKPVQMLNFRPNLVVAGGAPYDEDGWRRIRIGEIELDVVKSCSRCVFTTVDPQLGQRDADGEPLRTLASYRRQDGGVMFGQNLIARGHGRLRCGDRLEVLA